MSTYTLEALWPDGIKTRAVLFAESPDDARAIYEDCLHSAGESELPELQLVPNEDY